MNTDIGAGRLPADFQQGYGFVEDMLVNTRKMAEYTAPSDTVCSADATGLINWRRIASSKIMVCQLPNGGCGGMNGNMNDDYTRHNGGANVAYLDGHVKWAKWSTCEAMRYGP